MEPRLPKHLARRVRVQLATCAAGLLALAGGAAAQAGAPLADAMERRDGALVRSRLGDGAVDAAQVDGMTALHWAVWHTSQQLVVVSPNPFNRH